MKLKLTTNFKGYNNDNTSKRYKYWEYKNCYPTPTGWNIFFYKQWTVKIYYL